MRVTGVCDNCLWAPVVIGVIITIDEQQIVKGSCDWCLKKYVVLAELNAIRVELRPLPEPKHKGARE
jgi:hypothetical protein